MKILRDIVLDCGCDPFDWSAEARHEAATEVYANDEHSRVPTWMMDALSDATSRDTERKALLAAMELPTPVMRQAAIGNLVQRWLVEFTLDHLQRVAEEHQADWLAWRESA